MAYANPDALVSTEWLGAHLEDPTLRLLDGSFKLPGVTPTAAEDYARRHIPGALFFDIDKIADGASPLPHMLPEASAFAAMMGALGIGDEHRVVVYDSVGLGSAPRVWWTFRVFGKRDAAVLDGGLPKWRAEGRPLTERVPEPAPARFTARRDPALIRDRAALLANLETRREQVLDARSRGRFEGTAPEPRAGLRGGHIPGSRNLPFDELSDPATKRVLSAATLGQRFAASGIDPAKPVTCSCGSGVTAAVLAFGLHLLGYPEAAVYDGSWSEWGLPGDTPVATGPAAS